MKFDELWQMITGRNNWTDDSHLSVKASGVKKLAELFFEEGHKEGAAEARNDPLSFAEVFKPKL